MSVECPNPSCRKPFDSWKAVLAHLNQPRSSCFTYFSDSDRPAFFDLPAAPANEHAAPAVYPEYSNILSDPLDMLPEDSEPVNLSPGTSDSVPTPITVYHPTSGYILDRDGKNMLQRMEDDRYAYRRKHNHFYPFKDREEWELARYLCCSSLKQGEIDDFLKLPWVSR